MMLLILGLTTVLLAIAALHLAWAAGWWFPLGDERRLARAVVGSAGVQRMPGSVACALVAAALLGCASVLWWPGGWPRDLALRACGAVFLLRGGGAYVPAFRRFGPEEPFATLDRRVYAPLCLLTGTGLWVLTA